ncbi:MAG: internalin, partial [Marinilabiliales bacterium]
MQIKQILALFILLYLWNISANCQNEIKLTAEEIEAYTQQSKQMVSYLEGTLNFLGDPNEVASEKDIIINESYTKVFVNDEVQIEDDLDENREIALSKDVQAYLKDIDFFYKNVSFTYE